MCVGWPGTTATIMTDLRAAMPSPPSLHPLNLSPSPSLSPAETQEAIDACLSCLAAHLANAEIQIECLQILSNFACDSESNRDYIVENGGLTLAAVAMRHCQASGDGGGLGLQVKVQSAACALLANATAARYGCNAKDVRTKAGQEVGMVPLVVAALRLRDRTSMGGGGSSSSDDPVELARYGCSALAGLAANHPANCALAGEAGGIDAVLDVLGRYGCGGGGGMGGMGGGSIDTAGDANSLAAGEHHTRTTNVDAQGVRVGDGDGDAGERAETEEVDEETAVVDQGLVALHHLTANCRPNAELLARRPGGVAIIVAAIRNRPAHERIQRHGLALIRREVELPPGAPQCADSCVRCGGVSVIVRALEVHPRHEVIQVHGVALFRRLAGTDPRRVELGLAGAVELTVKAMTTFANVREVQFQAAAALHNLSIDSERNGDRVGAAGGIGALLTAVEATFEREDDEALVDVCCRTLHRVSYVGSNKVRIRTEADRATNLLHSVSRRYPKTCGRTAKGVLKNV